jgi:hypothetical protein
MDIGRALIAIGLAGLAGTAIYHLRTHHKPSWTSEVPMENLIRSCNRLKGEFTIEINPTRYVCTVRWFDENPIVIPK